MRMVDDVSPKQAEDLPVMAAHDVAIRVDDVSKCYRIYPSTVDIFKEIIGLNSNATEHWALQGISFEVKRGEVVGIIGPNGAGKSTLLRIIAGTLAATEGSVNVSGKMVALLELGTGFHPEFSGRDNIVMGGLSLGMTRAEIDAKAPSIIRFSELDRVIDQPMKTYSSGMWSRLAFSTAISVEPDIFIIDEALAAGDAYFVGKCLQRIDQIVKSGTTVLFVAHSSGLVQRFCRRAIHIDQGKIVDAGNAHDVTSRYESLVLERLSRSLGAESASGQSVVEHEFADDGAEGGALVTEASEDSRSAEDQVVVPLSLDETGAFSESNLGWASNSRSLSIRRVWLTDDAGDERNVFEQENTITVNVDVTVEKNISSPFVYIKIYRSDGYFVYSFNSQHPYGFETGKWEVGRKALSLELPRLKFGHGDYLVSVHVYPFHEPGQPVRQAYAIQENKVMFSVKWKLPISSLFHHDFLFKIDDDEVGRSDHY